MKRGIGLLKTISSFEIKTEVLRQLVNGLIEKTRFTDLLNKIHYANYERIERKWFNYKVRGPPTRGYIDILFRIDP